MEELLLPAITNRIQELKIKPTEIKMDLSHYDILFYTKGGFFSEHRDMVGVQPNFINRKESGRWRLYTFVLCLDSNIGKNTEDGTTQVFLPSRSWVLNDYITAGKKLVQHIYQHSKIPLNYIIFPAEALHSSSTIENDNYKLALKCDFWLKMPNLDLDKEMYSELRLLNYNEECDCLLCKPYTYIKIIQGEKYEFVLPKVLWFEIISFVKIERNECIRDIKGNCDCTCMKCIDDEYTVSEVSDYDDYTDSDVCNGYGY